MRADNADERLTRRGRAAGVVGDNRMRHFESLSGEMSALRGLLEGTQLSAREWDAVGVVVRGDGHRRSGYRILEYPDVTPDKLMKAIPSLAQFSRHALERVMIEGSYASYLAVQKHDVELFRRENLEIPVSLDVTTLPGLSAEAKEKLVRHRPPTLNAAAKISGITPAHILLLMRHIKTTSRPRRAEQHAA